MPDPTVSQSETWTVRRTGMLNDGQKDGTITMAVRSHLGAAERSAVLHWLPWRADGCLIFACIDPEDTEGINDERIGEMVEPKLAEDAATAHNVALREAQNDA